MKFGLSTPASPVADAAGMLSVPRSTGEEGVRANENVGYRKRRAASAALLGGHLMLFR